jgi:hypothetical protein
VFPVDVARWLLDEISIARSTAGMHGRTTVEASMSG